MKILYAVQGEGMGHSTRSKAIIEELIEHEHDVMFAAGSRAFRHLSEFFPKKIMLSSTHIIYRNNKVSAWRTVLYNLFSIPKYMKNVRRLSKKLKEFNPDVIITDFEPFSAYLGWFKGIPTISLDNEQIQTMTDIDYPWHDFFSYMKSLIVVRLFMPRADYYLITSFFYPKKRNDDNNVFLFPPILRKSIRQLKPVRGDKILVYQTSRTNKKLLKILKQLKHHQFVIYGFERDEVVKNCEFRKFADHTSFFNTLVSAKAVIMNGGFSLMSECLYLRKPVLSIPVAKQFEQINNARYLEKMGYGKSADEATEEGISSFLDSLSVYEKNLKKFKREDNSRLLKKLEEIFDEIKKQGKHAKKCPAHCPD